MPKPDLRELARRIFDQSPGDGLGLALDPEAQLDLADVAAERYFQEPSVESLAPWREMVDGVGSSFGASDLGADLRMRLDTHRLLLAASERWQAGNTPGIDGLRACVSRVSEEVLASEPSRAAELIRGLGEFIVSTLWGRQARTV